MGKRVENLQVRLQTGSDSTLVASWTFDASNATVSPGAVKVGDWVTVKEGSTWYNGVGIASHVFGQEWQVIEVAGDRAVLGPNRSGASVNSPINVANLVGGSGGSTTVTEDTLERYIYTWFYDTGDGFWYTGSSSDQGPKGQSYQTWDPPDNAIRVHFHVIPVSTTHKVNGQDARWWTGEVAIAQWVRPEEAPEQLGAPEVGAEGYALTASFDDIDDPLCEEVQFQVYDGAALFATGASTVRAAMASYRCAIRAGGSYRVRARAARMVGSGRLYGEWGPYADAVGTVPAAPSGITSVKGTSATSVRVEWAAATGAETYELERAESADLLGSSDASTTVTGIEGTSYTVTGLESGRAWWFRVRAANAQGESAWTEARSVVIGSAPAAPTTWSSTTSAIVGEPVTLFWVHNAEDGSDEAYAQVELTVGGGSPATTTLDGETMLELDTSGWEEGGTVSWRVRTSGATGEYGPWSESRAIDVYAPPTLSLSLIGPDGQAASPLTAFPLRVTALAGPASQEPVGYAVSVRALDSYQALDQYGEVYTVAAGDEVLTRYVDTSDALDLSLSASDVDLEGGASYRVEVTVSMDSGLTASATADLEVSWSDQAWPLDCEIALDAASLSCYVTPYSRDPETGAANAGLDLAVYRRGHDGGLTEVASGIDSASNTVVTDPHPSLDFARYRVVATDRSTGAVSYYDAPGYPVGCRDVVIQWDEEWSDFDPGEEGAARMEPSWAGSMVRLPYNIEVSDTTEGDAALVRYIGREYPVSYQGTQLDATSQWTVDVPKGDADTLYALRRLAAWHGDAYVREPWGSGYWAHLSVSVGIRASSGLVPVSIGVTRVEGGA